MATSKHHIWVDKQKYEFTLTTVGDKFRVSAPGVIPFEVLTDEEAKDILRSVYHNWEKHTK